LFSSREEKTVRYSFGPLNLLRNPSGKPRVVSLAISVARSDRGGELLIPIAVCGLTKGVSIKVDASLFKRPSFDIHDQLERVDPPGTNPFLTWSRLYGQRSADGVSGGSTKHLVRGGVDFVITP
jgi:hypothetical protein